jgi:hypothetical protein
VPQADTVHNNKTINGIVDTRRSMGNRLNMKADCQQACPGAWRAGAFLHFGSPTFP